MKELDALLSAYLEDRYDTADDTEKAAFEALLALPDPDLVGYLLQRQEPASEGIAGVVEHILGRTSA
ncbi:MAG: succinate dehydrogenase assembly factor 2 [Woeseiaceae bacterium]